MTTAARRVLSGDQSKSQMCPGISTRSISSPIEAPVQDAIATPVWPRWVVRIAIRVPSGEIRIWPYSRPCSAAMPSRATVCLGQITCPPSAADHECIAPNRPRLITSRKITCPALAQAATAGAGHSW